MSDELAQLLSVLDADQARLAQLEKYATGTQPLAFLSPEAKAALGNRLGRIASNIPRLAVASLAERLRVNGFTGSGAEQVWDGWLRNDLDQLAPVAHREALTLGRSHIIVWGDRNGRARVSIESARQMAVQIDAGSREVIRAVKRWEVLTPAGVPERTFATLFEPDSITKYVGKSTSATSFTATEVIDNPLGQVPVATLLNADRILDDPLLPNSGSRGVSEIDDLAPLVDALNKQLTDMMVASEYTARPRRWATGIELVEEPVLDDDGNPVLDADGEPVVRTTNPIPEGNRAMIAENSEAKFGQLSGADMTGYENAVNVLLGQIMAVSALPSHYIGVFTDTPPSADALRAAEASLTARAEARQQMFGRAWEQVGRLMLAVENQADPDDYRVRVRWANPATRSVAQEADAKVKLHAEGILTREEVRADLGIDDTNTTTPVSPAPAPVTDTERTAS
ncbi:phage portal protein [Mycolicibacterium palauense]|uniref:phage portal protein n=1 Tax=Mycolicibacterium palauense TaxID=2034511 RepID=UPI000BFF1792|nr:phage portal protein [Mycolicibacterium palauense]